MKKVKDFFNSKNNDQHLLAVVLLIYILLDIDTPKMLAELIDNVYGVIIIVILAISVVRQVNPVVGVLTLIAVYVLIKRSNVATGNHN